MFLTSGPLDIQFLRSQLNGVRGGELSLNGLPELLIVDFGISIQIQPPQNGYNFLLTGQMPHGPQKSFQVLFVDVLVIPVINGLEGSPHTKVVTGLERALDVLCFEMQLNLLEDQLTHGSLYTHWQEFVGVEFLVGSLGCS